MKLTHEEIIILRNIVYPYDADQRFYRVDLHRPYWMSELDEQAVLRGLFKKKVICQKGIQYYLSKDNIQNIVDGNTITDSYILNYLKSKKYSFENKLFDRTYSELIDYYRNKYEAVPEDYFLYTSNGIPYTNPYYVKNHSLLKLWSIYTNIHHELDSIASFSKYPELTAKENLIWVDEFGEFALKWSIEKTSEYAGMSSFLLDNCDNYCSTMDSWIIKSKLLIKQNLDESPDSLSTHIPTFVTSSVCVRQQSNDKLAPRINNEYGTITTIDGKTYCKLYFPSKVIEPYKNIHLLKTKNNITCAIIEDKGRLMVIRRGQRKIIKMTNVENLLKHLDEIYLTCFPIIMARNHILDQLSDFIRINGGCGSIHGNIVDIDSENHITIFKGEVLGYTSSWADWHNGHTIHYASNALDLLPTSNYPVPSNLMSLIKNTTPRSIQMSQLSKQEKEELNFYHDNYSALALQESINKRNMTIIPDWFTDNYQWNNINFDFQNLTNEELFIYMIEHEQCRNNNLLMLIDK